jgi:hypothetical protein
MLNVLETDRLTKAVRTLREAGVVPAILGPLRTESAAFLTSLYASVLEEVPAFTASGNPDVLPELNSHLQLHIETACGVLNEQRDVSLDFVSEHARRRAEQKFPLDAVLASYRCLHRAMAVWIRDAAIKAADDSAHLRRIVAAVSDFTIEYTGAISTLITSEYVTQTRRFAEAEGDRRSELFKLVLSGYDEADVRIAQLLRRAGYLEQRQSFCVAVARSVDPREMENEARAQRMADAVSVALQNSPLRALIGIQNNLVTVIMSGPRRLSGWTAPHESIADRANAQLRNVGPAALIGVSSDAPSTSHIPAALREAQFALDFANVGDRVVPYARIPFRNMLVNIAAEQMQSALPSWVGTLLDADRKARGSLTATLRAYADADMNVLRTAKRMSIHPNTIYARMQRIDDMTGKNPLSYNALTELLLATDCAILLK